MFRDFDDGYEVPGINETAIRSLMAFQIQKLSRSKLNAFHTKLITSISFREPVADYWNVSI